MKGGALIRSLRIMTALSNKVIVVCDCTMNYLGLLPLQPF